MLRKQTGSHNTVVSNHLREIFERVRGSGTPEQVNLHLRETLQMETPWLIGGVVLARANPEMYKKRLRLRRSSIYANVQPWAEAAIGAEDIALAAISTRPDDGSGRYTQRFQGQPRSHFEGTVMDAVIVGEESRQELRLRLVANSMFHVLNSLSGEGDAAVVRVIAPDRGADPAGFAVHTQIRRVV